MPSVIACNLLIDNYPPPRCSLPVGHSGVCQPFPVPATLSAAAADVLRSYDDIDSTRLAIHAERATLLVALRTAIRQRRVLAVSSAAHIAALIFIAVCYWMHP